ncbi:putative glucose-6-phosphate 1-epimerase isoform X1 [Bidens hawaiensis]|uniref:putative glucose-6-phosphate 1-epimerase isoform X1 n=1 Tax=Bidens hawaiensis TaxID=980011 RepID=UPI004049F9F3
MGHPAAVWDSKIATERVKDLNGIGQIVLRNSQGASAKVSLHGGQVVSWRNERGEELLFASHKENGKGPKATRGGITVCFPQFGSCGSLEQHGFARNKIWTVDENPPSLPAKDSSGKSFVDLLLKPTDEDLKCWPHRFYFTLKLYNRFNHIYELELLFLSHKWLDGNLYVFFFSFELRLRVCLGPDGNLALLSRVRNIHGKPFSFSFAYHSYLSVSDISEVRVEGLETMDYLDNLCHKERFTEQGDAITFEAEIERVYISSPSCVAVLDHERKRTYVLRKEGLPDVVVWNPWEKKPRSKADLGEDEYRQMVCVNGAVIEKPVTLKPGEEWTGRSEIIVVPSSFCGEGLCF